MAKTPIRKRKVSQKNSDQEAVDYEARLKANLEVTSKLMSFGKFLSASIEPKISHSEVIVCFADIRGFTRYCKNLQEDDHDSKIQNFLKQYFSIFVEALMRFRTKWDIQHEKGKLKEYSLGTIELIAPTMFKNLGDGMMLIWELPSNTTRIISGQLNRDVLDLASGIETRFYYHFRNLTRLEKDSYSEQVEQLDIGLSLARGHAWRLEFAHGVDYAGSVINLCSRLLDYARPKGMVVQYLMSQTYCDEVIRAGDGRLAKITGLKGFTKDAVVWLSKDVDSSQQGIQFERSGT